MPSQSKPNTDETYEGDLVNPNSRELYDTIRRMVRVFADIQVQRNRHVAVSGLLRDQVLDWLDDIVSFSPSVFVVADSLFLARH